MDTKVNYSLIGAFVIILSTALILGFFWLSTLVHHKAYETYLVYASGGVTGLTIQSPVQYNGVRVGYVDKIELDKMNPQLVKIYLKIEEGTVVTESTVATLIPQGITGLVYVGLQAQTSQAPKLKPSAEHLVAVIPYKKPFLLQITEVLPELTTNFKEIAGRFNKTFSNENIESFTEILSHLNHTTQMLDQQSDTIRKSLESLNIMLKNGAASSKYLQGTILSVKQTINKFDETGQKINLGMDDINMQVIPNLQELLSRLNNTAENLKDVSEDIKQNPSIIIRGTKPPAPGPGE